MARQAGGGCMCGRVRYTAAVEDNEAYLCHCRMCQRASGNVSFAMKTVRKADVRWEREPDYYASSPIARRGFCSACGTSLTFDYPDSEKIDLIVGSRRSVRFRAEAPFRVGKHASRLDQYGGPARDEDGGVSASRRPLGEDGWQAPHLTVIASAAQQSSAPIESEVDCFVASLLAMTGR
ncbi:MAG TPA: GFA family protein [Allosphingosinicella sp.]|nr:GFA family protein [Allosphingosinicella sp.]